MTWQGVVSSVLCLLLGAVIGYFLGLYTASRNAVARAVDKEDAADAKADAARDKIDADLAKVVDETRQSDAKELADALNKDFSDPPPGL